MERGFTGERLETSVCNANAVKHLHRYAIASIYAKGKKVLDIASGEGYGSNLLSNYASFVYGVDIDNYTIKKAKLKYRKKNIQFSVGSTSAIPLDDNSIDLVVSFETLEHHVEHDQMLREIKRVLRPKGICIISTPDKHFYSDKRSYINEFHKKELYKHEFIKLVDHYFSNYQVMTQSYLNGNSYILDEVDRDKTDLYTGNYNHFSGAYSPPEFLIAIISDRILEKQNNSIFDGALILKNSTEVHDMVKDVYSSYSYRIGHKILSPLKFLKRNLRRFMSIL